MNMIKLLNVGKVYHSRPALKCVDLGIEDGTMLTLFGPNGAGKTTLLKILAGIMSPSEGRVIYSPELSRHGDVRGSISYLGHKNSLYNELTVLENINFVFRLFGRKNGKEAIEKTLREFGLWERRRDPVRELSQGMKRRLAIAKGFITDSRIFVFDEPFTGLDLRWRDTILSGIRALKAKRKTTIICTHLLEEGYELGNIFAFFHRGSLLFLKRRDEIGLNEIKERFRLLEEPGR